NDNRSWTPSGVGEVAATVGCTDGALFTAGEVAAVSARTNGGEVLSCSSSTVAVRIPGGSIESVDRSTNTVSALPTYYQGGVPQVLVLKSTVLILSRGMEPPVDGSEEFRFPSKLSAFTGGQPADLEVPSSIEPG